MREQLSPDNHWRRYRATFRRHAQVSGYSDEQIQECLQYARKLWFQGFPVIYDQAHLAKLVGIRSGYLGGVANRPEVYYRRFEIPKRTGEMREILEPLPNLKKVQRWLLDNLLYVAPCHPCAKAFVPGLGLTDGARFHLRQERVLSIDIRNFFPSVPLGSVYHFFSQCGYTDAVSTLLSKLVTYEGALPQGAPTSPFLANIVCVDMDAEIYGFCRSKRLRYTRYADDLSISGVFEPSEVIGFVYSVLAENGFLANTKKTKVMERSTRQEVTGIVVNSRLRAPIETRKRIRQAAYYIHKFGFESHVERASVTRRNHLKHLMGLCNFVLYLDKSDPDALNLRDTLRKISSNQLTLS